MNPRVLLISPLKTHHKIFTNYLLKKKINLSILVVKNNIKKKFHTNYISQIQNIYEKKQLKKTNFYTKKIKYEKIDNINSKKNINFFKKKFDIGVSFGCDKLDMNVVKQFRYGIINVHRGIIEKYRGLDSDLWAIYHKDLKNIGVTIHFINANLDKGNIILQRKLIKKKIVIKKIRLETTLSAAYLVNKILKNYKRIKSKKQKEFGRYYSFMPSILQKNL